MTDLIAPDPYTIAGRLCDDDGIVRRGLMHHGTDYPCTGSAHPPAGGHIQCTTPIHQVPSEPRWYPATLATPGFVSRYSPEFVHESDRDSYDAAEALRRADAEEAWWAARAASRGDR